MIPFARSTGWSQSFSGDHTHTASAVNLDKHRNLDPRDPANGGKLWIKLHSRNGRYYYFFWRRICIALAILMLAGWLAVTAAAWANVKYRRGFSEARFLDLAVPWRWHRYKAAIAAHYLALGRLNIEQGNPDVALNYLNASLALEPGSLESRRLGALAQFRLGFKTAALALLRPGLAPAADAGDEAFLRSFFDVAFDLQADDAAFAAGAQLLPPRPDRSRIHQLIALQVATARYNRGHYLEAERILANWKLEEFPEGEVLLARCYAERGMNEIAIQRLDGDLARFTQRDGIYTALERLARDQGLPQVLLRYALLRELAEPARPQARIDLLYAYHSLDRSADVRREINSYCSDFRADANAVAILAQFAADTGEPDTAERARDLARAGGFPTTEFDLKVVQACIVAHDYRRALFAIKLAQAEGKSVGRAYEAIMSGFKAVSLFGAGYGGGELAFSYFMTLPMAPPPHAGLFLSEELHRVGFGEQSRQLLERVCTDNPDDEPALTELIRADAGAGNRMGLLANLPRFLKMRKPSRDVLAASLPLLDPVRDAALREQVSEALAERSAAP